MVDLKDVMNDIKTQIYTNGKDILIYELEGDHELIVEDTGEWLDICWRESNANGVIAEHEYATAEYGNDDDVFYALENVLQCYKDR